MIRSYKRILTTWSDIATGQSTIIPGDRSKRVFNYYSGKHHHAGPTPTLRNCSTVLCRVSGQKARHIFIDKSFIMLASIILAIPNAANYVLLTQVVIDKISGSRRLNHSAYRTS